MCISRPDGNQSFFLLGSWLTSENDRVVVSRTECPDILLVDLLERSGRQVLLRIRRECTGDWWCGQAILRKQSNEGLHWEFADGRRFVVWQREAHASYVWLESQTKDGSELIQKEICEAPDAKRLEYFGVFLGRVWELLRNSRAHHVLQKLIEVLPPHRVTPIVAEMRSVPFGVKTFSKHRFGCQIVQRLLEHGNHEDIVNDVFDHFVELSNDSFGKHVVQCLQEQGHQKERLFDLIKAHVPELCKGFEAPRVLLKAFTHGSAEFTKVLAGALLQSSELVPMLRGRFRKEIKDALTKTPLDERQRAKLDQALLEALRGPKRRAKARVAA
jgi:hypothetical protein